MTSEQHLADRSWWRPVLLTTAVVAVGHGFGRFSFPLVLPAMRADLIGSYGAAGWLVTANFGAHLVGVLGVSILARRVPATTMLKSGVLISVLGMAVLSIAPNYSVTLLGMAIAGLGAAGTWVPAPALVAEIVPPGKRGLALGVVTAGVGIGIVVAGRIVAAVQEVSGQDAWRAVWAIEAACGAVVAIVVVRSLHTRRQGPAIAPHRGLALSRLPRAGSVVAAYAAYGVVFSLYTGFLVVALEDDGGFTSTHAGFAFSLLGLMSIAGGMVLGRLSDVLGRPGTLVCGYAGMAICSLSVPIGREPWAMTSAGAFGLLMTGVGTVIAAYVGDHLDAADVGPAFGTLTLFLGLSQIAAPPVGGWMADRMGSFTGTYVLAAAAAIVGLVASSGFLRGTSSGPAPPPEPVVTIS